MIEGEDKADAVNEVPEYAAEIHEYLREMEVNFVSECTSMLLFYRCLHSLTYDIKIPAENQAKSRIHEKATRHHDQHESHPGGLAGGGWRRVQASKRDSLPGCELHRSLPVLDVCLEGEASASWDCCHAAGFVCVKFLLQSGFKACLVHFCKGATCLIAGNLRRSTLLRWQSLFTSQMTPTPRSKC